MRTFWIIPAGGVGVCLGLAWAWQKGQRAVEKKPLMVGEIRINADELLRNSPQRTLTPWEASQFVPTGPQTSDWVPGTRSVYVGKGAIHAHFRCHWCNQNVELDEIHGTMVDHPRIAGADYLGNCNGSGKVPHI